MLRLYVRGTGLGRQTSAVGPQTSRIRLGECCRCGVSPRSDGRGLASAVRGLRSEVCLPPSSHRQISAIDRKQRSRRP